MPGDRYAQNLIATVDIVGTGYRTTDVKPVVDVVESLLAATATL